MQQNVLNMDKELQFNSWLFESMKKELIPHSFQVELNQLNRSIVPDVCEYSNSVLFMIQILYTRQIWML